MHSHNHINKPRILPDAPPVIEVEKIGMRRGDRNVLTDVSLSVRRGDFLAITGPNGGGKTTLLRIILGLLQPTSGHIRYFNPSGKEGDKPAFGYLPQKNAVDAHFPVTVSEVIASGLLTMRGIDNGTRRHEIERVLELIDMTDLANRPIGHLSGGQLQRALFGRAIIRKPEILVLDEPLSYIDKHFEERLYDIIDDISHSATILLVSHEMSEISAMANRHIIVDHTLTECCATRHFIPPQCTE
ncbi:MAG: metal ABC transporter ATP-binding protein [Muribaculaceae bacterium]